MMMTTSRRNKKRRRAAVKPSHILRQPHSTMVEICIVGGNSRRATTRYHNCLPRVAHVRISYLASLALRGCIMLGSHEYTCVLALLWRWGWRRICARHVLRQSNMYGRPYEYLLRDHPPRTYKDWLRVYVPLAEQSLKINLSLTLDGLFQLPNHGECQLHQPQDPKHPKDCHEYVPLATMSLFVAQRTWCLGARLFQHNQYARHSEDVKSWCTALNMIVTQRT